MSADDPARPGSSDNVVVGLLTVHLDRHAVGSPEPLDASLSRFEGLAEQLASAATWTDPPAGLRDRILAQVRAPVVEPAAVASAEAAEPEVAEPPVVEPARPGRPRWSWWPAGLRARWGRLAWAVPAAALGAAVFTGAVLAVDRALQPDPLPAEVYTATGTELAPRATAEVTVRDTPSGFSVVLELDGMPAAAPGSYYAAWLRGPTGTVPLGSFHERRTGWAVELWSGVDPEDYPTLLVTLQAEGDPPVPSQLVVLTATLDR